MINISIEGTSLITASLKQLINNQRGMIPEYIYDHMKGTKFCVTRQMKQLNVCCEDNDMRLKNNWMSCHGWQTVNKNGWSRQFTFCIHNHAVLYSLEGF